MSPVGWKPEARQQFSAGKTRIFISRTVAGEFQLKSAMHPFGWKPLQPSLDLEQISLSKVNSRPSSSVQKKRDIAVAQR